MPLLFIWFPEACWPSPSLPASDPTQGPPPVDALPSPVDSAWQLWPPGRRRQQASRNFILFTKNLLREISVANPVKTKVRVESIWKYSEDRFKHFGEDVRYE